MRWWLVGSLLFLGACDTDCEKAWKHRLAVTRQYYGHDLTAEIDRKLEAASLNEIELCEGKMTKAYLDCYLGVTAADLKANMFAFEHRCDDVHRSR
jgi:hypothetical protein